MENLLIILRGIAAGHKTIYVDPNGNYISKQAEGMNTLLVNCEEHDIESRLKYELYGEFPISNEVDYINFVRRAFNFNILK
jgi:hypothetical protein